MREKKPKRITDLEAQRLHKGEFRVKEYRQDWGVILGQLQQKMTFPAICEFLGRATNTVSSHASGTTRPSHEVGEAYLALHRKYCGTK